MDENEQQYTILDSSEPNKDGLPAVAGKCGGPRTPPGKQRSKYNTTRYGIFSKAVLLEGESRKEYSSLLDGLRESFLPVGRMEEQLVEELAMIAWRRRRILGAECAEVQRLQEAIEYGEEEELTIGRRIGSQEKALALIPYGGLLRAELNVEIVNQCVDKLGELRDKTFAEGVHVGWVHLVLQEIYNTWAPMTFALRAAHGLALAMVVDHKTNDDNLRDDLKRYLMHGIEVEISELRKYKETIEKYQAEYKKQGKLRHSVLDYPALDRLMRYEAHLSRLEDRTLSQLERLQRMRLGHPVPPPLKVQVSEN